jgi:hypothetical protein
MRTMAKHWELGFAPAVVSQLYRQVLEREVDDIGLVGYGGQLVRGEASVKETVRGLGLSSEYAQHFLIPFTPQQQVEFCYRHFLARPSDVNGLHFWMQQAEQHGMNAVINGLINSDEYANRFGEDKIPGS